MKKRTIALSECLLCAFLLAACSCGDDDDDDDAGGNVDDDNAADDDGAADDDDNDDSAGEVFRIAVITDPVIHTNEVEEWNNHLEYAIETINQRGDVDFTVVLGDLAANLTMPYAPGEPGEPYEGALELFVTLMAELNTPYYVVPGEKDYWESYIMWALNGVEWADWATREAFLKETLGDAFPGADPWYAFQHKGVTFFGGNTAAGPLREDGRGMTGSMGAEQLTALSERIATGETLIFMGHHMPPGVIEPDGEQTLEEVLNGKAGNVMGLFNGHLLGFREYEYAGVNGISFDGLQESPLYLAIVEIDPIAKTMEIVNRADLPFPDPWSDLECTPGQDTVGPLTDFVDTMHVVFVDSLSTGNAILDLILAGIEMGETPLAFQVVNDNGGDSFDLMLTFASNCTSYLSPEECGDHSVGLPIYPADYYPCQTVEFQVDDPCMASVNASVVFNVLSLIVFDTLYYNCGIGLNYEADYDVSFKLGPDAGSNLSLADAQLSFWLDQYKVIDALENFIVDLYCAYECVVDNSPEPGAWAGCDPADHGHEAACAAGTLTFDQTPLTCDPLIGDIFKLPSRLIIELIDAMFAPDFSLNMKLGGWGHEMTPDYDLSHDWSIDPRIFTNNPNCE